MQEVKILLLTFRVTFFSLHFSSEVCPNPSLRPKEIFWRKRTTFITPARILHDGKNDLIDYATRMKSQLATAVAESPVGNSGNRGWIKRKETVVICGLSKVSQQFEFFRFGSQEVHGVGSLLANIVGL